MSYLDFELEIAAGSGREYPVAVIRSAAGEAHETMRFPFDELALENQLLALQNALLRSGGKHRQILLPEEQMVQNFGRALFDALIIGEVRSRYAVSQREAFSQGKGLRLKLRIQSSELAALPWEFLYDPGMATYVCLSSNTPIVRYLELPQPPQPLTVTLPLRILGLLASPKGLADLDVDNEKLRIEKATEDLRTHGLLELTWLQGRTWHHLQRAMRGGPWHIFHFIGHGGFDSRTDEGLIALEDDAGEAHYLTATQLGRLLADHRPLRLVVLNSCEGARGSVRDIFSSTAAILVRRGIPAVLAMQYEITDMAAIELSHAFYEALADGMPVDTAVSEARKAISLGVENTVEWGTPVLYMRSPDGVLFDLIRESSQQREQPTQSSTGKTPLTKPSARVQQKMLSDPVFLFNQPLPDPSEFYGRIRERETLLNRTRNGASTSIVGPRRVGKTWLMSYLRLIAGMELGARFLVGYLDATTARCATVVGFTAIAIEALTVQKLAFKDADDGLAELEQVVQELVSRNQVPILCIDEFEGFYDRQMFDLHFFSALRAMTQVGLSLIVASKGPLIDIVGEYGKTSGFFNVFEQLSIKPFSVKEAERFVQFKGTQAHFTDQERKQLLHYGREAGGYWPLRLQLVGKMLLEDKLLATKEKDPDYYRPNDTSFWQEFEQRLEETYRGVVR